MLKPIALTEDAIGEAVVSLSTRRMTSKVFAVLQGTYGSLFLSKFQTGHVDQKGRDEGIMTAKSVWAGRLAKFDESTVAAALERCLAVHQDFPPNLPQFIALCEACRPRDTYRPPSNRLDMSDGLRSQYARQARAINERHAQLAMDRKTGFVEIEPGLEGLKQAIANAIGAAGGDEAGALLKLGRRLSRGSSV